MNDGPNTFIMMFLILHIMLMLLMIPFDPIPLDLTNLVKHFTKIFEFDNQLLNKLNNEPHLSYEWEMETRERCMKQNTIIIVGQGQTIFLSKEIINNQTRLPLIINRGCNKFNKQMEKIQKLLN